MRRLTVAVLAAVLVVAAAGCGSSSKKSSSASGSSSSSNSGGAYGGSGGASSGAKAAGSKLKLAADEEGKLYFNPSKLSAKAGKATLVMNNPKTTGKMHGIAVEGNGLDKDGKVVGPGSTSTLSVTLKPGKYTFYCPVPGHRQGGMQGTLTVQ